MKTHYTFPGQPKALCGAGSINHRSIKGLTGWVPRQTTTNLKAVTCRTCLASATRLGVQGRATTFTCDNCGVTTPIDQAVRGFVPGAGETTQCPTCCGRTAEDN